jgi:hypothetical protein
MKGKRHNGNTERPIAARRIATHNPPPKHSQRSSVLVEVLVRYFDDNVIFFRIHSIHPAGPAAAAVFIPLTPSTGQSAM